MCVENKSEIARERERKEEKERWRERKRKRERGRERERRGEREVREEKDGGKSFIYTLAEMVRVIFLHPCINTFVDMALTE